MSSQHEPPVEAPDPTGPPPKPSDAGQQAKFYRPVNRIERTVDQYGWPRYQTNLALSCIHGTYELSVCHECLKLARTEDREDALSTILFDLSNAIRELRAGFPKKPPAGAGDWVNS